MNKGRILGYFSALVAALMMIQGCGPGYSNTSDVKMASGNKRTTHSARPAQADTPSSPATAD